MTEGRLVLVLHSHLPYVLGHGIWPHGESWLFEAAAETYLPLLVTCEQLVSEGIRPAFTVEISPVLGEQLDDPRFRLGFPGHLQTLEQAAVADAESFRSRSEPQMAELAERWARHFAWLAEQWSSHKGDLLGGFAELARGGAIELATCARSHGLLPLLGSPGRVRRQVEDGAAWFRFRFGHAPRGIWMPECAYRPAGPWSPPALGPPDEALRPGNEQFLEEAAFHWTVVDHHLVAGGEPLGSYPAKEARLGDLLSPHQLYAIGESAVAAFPRDPATTLQVWSGEWGYPANPWYLEFHKKHSEGGLRYWRVSEKGADLGAKRPYEPERIPALVSEQAHHFAGVVAGVIDAARQQGIGHPIVTAPYDTELFGHWWSEGVDWLAEARRELHRQGVRITTASEALAAVGPAGHLALPAGSWGDGGDLRVWDNDATRGIWDAVYRTEALLDEVGAQLPAEPGRHLQAICRQLERSVLLIEASDWPFLVTTKGATDYAVARVQGHSEDAVRLAMAAKRLAGSGRPVEAEQRLLEELATRDPLWLPIRPGLP